MPGTYTSRDQTNRGKVTVHLYKHGIRPIACALSPTYMILMHKRVRYLQSVMTNPTHLCTLYNLNKVLEQRVSAVVEALAILALAEHKRCRCPGGCRGGPAALT